MLKMHTLYQMKEMVAQRAHSKQLSRVENEVLAHQHLKEEITNCKARTEVKDMNIQQIHPLQYRANFVIFCFYIKVWRSELLETKNALLAAHKTIEDLTAELQIAVS